MSAAEPAARLAKCLPPDGARRALEVLARMEARGEAGEVARIVIAPGGAVQLVVLEHYAWRSEGVMSNRERG